LVVELRRGVQALIINSDKEIILLCTVLFRVPESIPVLWRA
jgi:hypothetical protein